MYYETEVWFEEGQTAEFRLAERVWYQYLADSAAVGSPDYIVRRIYNPAKPGQPPVNYGYGLIYNTQGTLWFITQVQWTGATCPQEEHEVISRHEFRSVGRAMRLTRQRDPEYFHAVVDGTNVWHDYDGDEIYADTRLDYEYDSPFTVTPLAAHEPGIGKVDYVCRNAQDEIVPCGSEGASEPEPMLSHYHGDQIGSTRAITGPGSAGVPPASIQGRIVYTAFGERVGSDGTVGTRYQYAGAWGYQSDLYEDAGANALPSSLFPAPFIHVGHRWYDPSTGRFLQRDPIGIAGGANVYAYSHSSPINFIDDEGLNPKDWWQQKIGPGHRFGYKRIPFKKVPGILARPYIGGCLLARGAHAAIGAPYEDPHSVLWDIGCAQYERIERERWIKELEDKLNRIKQEKEFVGPPAPPPYVGRPLPPPFL